MLGLQSLSPGLSSRRDKEDDIWSRVCLSSVTANSKTRYSPEEDLLCIHVVKSLRLISSLSQSGMTQYDDESILESSILRLLDVLSFRLLDLSVITVKSRTVIAILAGVVDKEMSSPCQTMPSFVLLLCQGFPCILERRSSLSQLLPGDFGRSNRCHPGITSTQIHVEESLRLSFFPSSSVISARHIYGMDSHYHACAALASWSSVSDLRHVRPHLTPPWGRPKGGVRGGAPAPWGRNLTLWCSEAREEVRLVSVYKASPSCSHCRHFRCRFTSLHSVTSYNGRV